MCFLQKQGGLFYESLAAQDGSVKAKVSQNRSASRIIKTMLHVTVLSFMSPHSETSDPEIQE